jgi:hypothetical protein
LRIGFYCPEIEMRQYAKRSVAAPGAKYGVNVLICERRIDGLGAGAIIPG